MRLTVTSAFPVLRVLLVLVAGTAALAACHHETTTATPSMTSTTAASLSNDRAIELLAQVRCDHMANCNDIGPGRKYMAQDDCMTDLRSKEANHLAQSECSIGIDPQRLDRCVSEIRDSRCGNVMERFESQMSCRTSQLCPR